MNESQSSLFLCLLVRDVRGVVRESLDYEARARLRMCCGLLHTEDANYVLPPFLKATPSPNSKCLLSRSHLTAILSEWMGIYDTPWFKWLSILPKLHVTPQTNLNCMRPKTNTAIYLSQHGDYSTINITLVGKCPRIRTSSVHEITICGNMMTSILGVWILTMYECRDCEIDCVVSRHVTLASLVRCHENECYKFCDTFN
jgi:hypothetical protein